MNLYYSSTIQQGNCHLDAEESFHAVRVMRLKEGDTIHITDGQGNIYTGSIMSADAKSTAFTITNTVHTEIPRKKRIHIAIAPTKNIERFEFFLEKATEIGIDEVTPLLCEHSERRTLRVDRLEKVIIAAIKQSQHLYKPLLHELTSFESFMKQDSAGLKTIAHCIRPIDTHLKNVCGNEQSITILIGPEGDFSPAEADLASQNNFTEVSLGNSRLRTETAGIAACHIINLF